MSSGVEALVFNRSGANPVQIEPQIESVAWRLNRTGQARMYLPYSNPACTPDNLRLGNRVLLRFESGLRPFGGVIDVPRRRTPSGVTFNVYTGDRILSWRRTAKTRAFASTAPGTIYRTLIEEENAEWSTGIGIGAIYTGGTERNETYHYHSLLDLIWQLQRLSGEEYEVTPLYQNGKLTFVANWYAHKGSDLSGKVLLVEDRNVEPPTLDEQGPIASRVLCPGGGAGGTTWDDRLVGEDVDVTSRSAYGYREYAEVQTGVFDQATLDASASSLLQEMKDPRGRFTLVALDRPPARFSTYDVGDTVTVQAFLAHPEWAVDDTVRVVGREWTPDNACRLEVK